MSNVALKLLLHRDGIALARSPSNRNARFRQQPHPPAQLDKLRTYLLDAAAVVLAEVRNRLVVRRQSTEQPHHFDVAPRFAFQPAARLHPVEVAIDVELQEG